MAILTPIVTAAAWLFRLEGRLNTHEKACEERQKRLDERHEHIGEHLETLSAAALRMEHKIDHAIRSR